MQNRFRFRNFWRLVVLGALVYSPAIPALAGLVGHWRFDEGAGTAISDSSGLGNNGTLVNATPSTWTNSLVGGGLYFDGATGPAATYVRIPDSASLHMTNAISFAAWIRCDDVARDAPILDKEGPGQLAYWFGAFGAAHFGLLLDGDGNGPWTIMDRGNGNISQGLWVHIASTWDGSTIRHYLNGVALPVTTVFGGSLNISTADLIIGANVPFNSTAFKGIVADVRLYNHALSPAEIKTLVGTPRQMVGRWSFDEASGTNILDSSGLANHGTLVNLKANTWTAGINGTALYFDGTTGADSTYVNVPDSPSLHIAAEISFVAWVRCDDISRDAPILAKEGDGYLSFWFGTFGVNSEGAVPGNFGMLLDLDGNQPWTTYARSQGAIPQSQWVQLASTWDGATIRHYLNGRMLPQTGSFPGPIHYSSAFLAIGVNSLNNFTAFKGAMDEVSLYNYALSADEVESLYLRSGLRFASIDREGNDLRLTWSCVAGQNYQLESSRNLAASGGFTALGPPVSVPVGYSADTTNYLHLGAFSNGQAGFYRVRRIP